MNHGREEEHNEKIIFVFFPGFVAHRFSCVAQATERILLNQGLVLSPKVVLKTRKCRDG